MLWSRVEVVDILLFTFMLRYLDIYLAYCLPGCTGHLVFSVFDHNLRDEWWFEFTICEVKKPKHKVFQIEGCACIIQGFLGLSAPDFPAVLARRQ